MSKFLGILLVFGLITFTAYQIVSLVRDIKARKQGKINNKGDNK